MTRGPLRRTGIVLVAILSGSALFASGYLLGQRQALQPGTPANEEAAFQPFWDCLLYQSPSPRD